MKGTNASGIAVRTDMTTAQPTYFREPRVSSEKFNALSNPLTENIAMAIAPTTRPALTPASVPPLATTGSNRIVNGWFQLVSPLIVRSKITPTSMTRKMPTTIAPTLIRSTARIVTITIAMADEIPMGITGMSAFRYVPIPRAILAGKNIPWKM